MGIEGTYIKWRASLLYNLKECSKGCLNKGRTLMGYDCHASYRFWYADVVPKDKVGNAADYCRIRWFQGKTRWDIWSVWDKTQM